jgi:hypothetical protein
VFFFINVLALSVWGGGVCVGGWLVVWCSWDHVCFGLVIRGLLVVVWFGAVCVYGGEVVCVCVCVCVCFGGS